MSLSNDHEKRCAERCVGATRLYAFAAVMDSAQSNDGVTDVFQWSGGDLTRTLAREMRCDCGCNTKTTGLTLIEVLLVTAIIGMLLVLLAPAVQAAREAARRIGCANQLKQVGIALQSHHDSYRYLPTNGGLDQVQSIPAAGGGVVRVFTHDYTSNRTFYWGVGDPSLRPFDQLGSWGYAILPYLELQSIYEKREWAASVQVYGCRSRRTARSSPVHKKDAWGEYEGGGWPWAKTDYAANAIIIANRPKLRKLADIRDGTSQTIIAGEKAFDPRVQVRETWYWDEPYFVGGSRGTYRDGLDVVRDRPGVRFKNNWGSPHPAGCQFLFADGSVRTIQHGISWMQMEHWLTPSSGQTSQFSAGD